MLGQGLALLLAHLFCFPYSVKSCCDWIAINYKINFLEVIACVVFRQKPSNLHLITYFSILFFFHMKSTEMNYIWCASFVVLANHLFVSVEQNQTWQIQESIIQLIGSISKYVSLKKLYILEFIFLIQLCDLRHFQKFKIRNFCFFFHPWCSFFHLQRSIYAFSVYIFSPRNLEDRRRSHTTLVWSLIDANIQCIFWHSDYNYSPVGCLM